MDTEKSNVVSDNSVGQNRGDLGLILLNIQKQRWCDEALRSRRANLSNSSFYPLQRAGKQVANVEMRTACESISQNEQLQNLLGIYGRVQQILDRYRALDQDRVKLTANLSRIMQRYCNIIEERHENYRELYELQLRIARSYGRLPKKMKAMVAIEIPCKEDLKSARPLLRSSFGPYERRCQRDGPRQTAINNGLTITQKSIMKLSLLSKWLLRYLDESVIKLNIENNHLTATEDSLGWMNLSERDYISQISTHVFECCYSNDNSNFNYGKTLCRNWPVVCMREDISFSDRTLTQLVDMVAKLECSVHEIMSTFECLALSKPNIYGLMCNEESDLERRYQVLSGGQLGDNKHKVMLHAHVGYTSLDILHSSTMCFHGSELDMRETGAREQVIGVQGSLNKLRRTHIRTLSSLMKLCEDRTNPPFLFNVEERGNRLVKRRANE